MKLRRPRMDIENKILIPFVCISLATVICFCNFFSAILVEI